MAIIENKLIFEDKPVFKKLFKDLKKAKKAVNTLAKSSKELAEALALVKKSNDGKEAEQLSNKTDKLTKSTKKLKDALIAEERVKQQILKANVKLAESRTKAARDLALVRQKTLEQNKANRELAKSQLGVKKSTNGLISSFKAMGKQLAGALGVTALIGLLVNQFKKASERVTTLNKLTRELKGTFDITTREAKKLASQINAMAQNFEGVDAKNLQISLTAIVKTFKDLSEQEALDLILEGFQKGSDNSGEFLDILKEYPSFFKKAGLSASEMFAIINQQVKEGVYSDKGVDAIKEATISLTENTQIVKDALRPLGESVNLQIRQKVEAGKAFEAMQLISKEMETLGVNSAEAQTIMADVFKGAGEDSDAFVRNLHNVSLSMEDVAKQTSIVSEANLELSESYNNFLLSVEDGTGIISNAIADITNMGVEFFKTATIFNETTIANKLKIIANAALSLFEKAFLPLVKVLRVLGIEMPRFRFEIEKNTESTDENTDAVKKNEKELVKEKEAVVKLTKSSQQLTREYKERIKAQDDLIKRQIKSIELADKEAEKEEAAALEIEERLFAEDEAITKSAENFDLAERIKQNAISRTKDEADEAAKKLAENALLIHAAGMQAGQAIGDLMAQGLLTFKEFSKILLKTTLDLVQRQVNIWLVGLLPRLILSLGPIGGPIAFGAIVVAINAGIAAAKAGIASFNEGIEYVPGTGNKDTVPAMLTPGERVVPAEINKRLEGISNADLPNLLNAADNNMLMAGLLMKGNQNSSDMVELLGRLGLVYKRGNENYIERATGKIERFI